MACYSTPRSHGTLSRLQRSLATCKRFEEHSYKNCPDDNISYPYLRHSHVASPYPVVVQAMQEEFAEALELYKKEPVQLVKAT